MWSQIFDIDRALLPQSSRVDREVFAIGDEGAIAAFRDAKAVDGGAGFEGQLVVELGSRAIGW